MVVYYTEEDLKAILREKDEKIKELMATQKSIDLDVHNLTEQLFEQAYKLVNDEKKKSAELKVRIEMLEMENAALKSTVKAHKRPTFSHRVLSSPTSLMTPVKLSKTPFRTLLNRYSNLASGHNSTKRGDQVKLMEPLFSEEEPSSSDKSTIGVQPNIPPALSKDIESLIAEVNESNTLDAGDLKTKLVDALRDQALCNQKLRSYIDNILGRVIEVYPQILEISPP
ncbi:FIP-RBD domain-containing protein [Aphelenchoides bicaudatus]|nr:FIP-RBD domain-containing protein [Aphelenchoides bicaudatus]